MSNVVIEDFQEQEKENPYAPYVASLIVAGEGKGATVIVPNADVKKTKFKFGRAANDAGHTARIRITEDLGDGTTRIVFTLTDKHKPRRRKGDSK